MNCQALRKWSCLLLTLAQFLAMTPAISLQGMEENCILSFVVPKEKMKSSCELDEKVNRRINAMEMKVNIYKQQVSELQLQLDKQREVNAEKLDNLERELRDSRVSTDMNFLIERRLALLEKEFEQLHSEVTTSSSPGLNIKPSTLDDRSHVFNAIDSAPVPISNFVKTLVQSEVKILIDNFTTRFEAYVQEQILLYNEVFKLLPKRGNDGSLLLGRASAPHLKDKDRTQLKDSKTDPQSQLMREFESVKSKLEDAGGKIAKQVGTYISDLGGVKTGKNVSHAAVNVTVSGTTGTYQELPVVNTSELVLEDDLFDSNESFSGENSEVNDTAHVDPFTPIDNDISASTTAQTNSKEGEANVTESPAEGANDKNWKENMIQDQYYKQAEFEERLRDEITSMLYSPLAEVMSLVEKQSKALEEQIRSQEEKNQHANRELTTHVKQLDQNVQAINLQLESLSQGFQDSFAKLDKFKSLEILVNEIKKNISSEPLTVSALEMDEQGKKIKKMERLMGVYHQSLEHYRNETKHEYKELKETIEKETGSVRALSKSLLNNVTSTLNSELSRLNGTFNSKFHDISEQSRIHEDNVLLMQIDMATFERKLNSKSSRSDREVENMQVAMDQLAIKQRDIRKKLDSLDKAQTSFGESLNITAKDVFDLKTEVKLTVLDEWTAFSFEYDSSRTDCHGDQYIKLTNYKPARIVGVVLCTHERYKIFLAKSLQSTFMNIGDSHGVGNDHCEFVGATPDSKIELSPYKPVFDAVQGYSRDSWGDQPILSYLNSLKPSPYWYQCGVTIP